MAKTKSQTFQNFSKFDRLPESEMNLARIRRVFEEIADFYGFEKIYTPILEDAKFFTPLAKAGLLEDLDPLACKTKNGEEFFLRFSGALAVLRAYQEQNMAEWIQPLKFRVETENVFIGTGEEDSMPRTIVKPREAKKIFIRPEWNLLMLGEDDPIAEAEVIQAIWKSLEDLSVDLSGLNWRMNALGCQGCRPAFRSALLAYLRPKAARLCKSCKKDLKESPTRIFSCWEEKCKILANNAPQILDFLCEGCKKHLRGLLEFLDENSIPYFLDAKFFKDGSYYNQLVFQLINSGAPVDFSRGEVSNVLVLAEGGRISRAAEILLNRKLDGVGLSLYLNPFSLILKNQGRVPDFSQRKIFLVQLGDLAKKKSLGLMETLRKGNLEVRESLSRDAIKSQLKVAERFGAEIALILGQKEALDKTVIVREMQSGIQEVIPQDRLIDFLRRKIC